MRNLSLLVVCLLAGIRLPAQEYRFRQYRVEQGLPSDVIKAVAQDSLGFFWIATDDGLVKYDGRRFTTYKSALHSQYAKGFLNTRDGRLLAIGDLDLVEVQNLVDTVIFKTLLHGTRSPTDSTLWYAKALYEDRAGNIWIAEPQSVLRYNGKSFQRFDFGAQNRSPVFIRSYNFFEDGEYLYAAAYSGKIYRLDEQTDQFVQLKKNLPDNTSHLLFRKGKLLVAAGDGLYETILKNGEIEKLQKALPINSASHLLQVSDSILWVSTYGEDVYKIVAENYTPLETLLYNFNGVNNTYESHDGDLWISTDKGIILVQKNQFITADINSQAHFIEGLAYDSQHNYMYYCYKETLVELRPGPNGTWDNNILYDNPDSYFQCLQFGKQGLWASTAFDVLLFQEGKIKHQWNFSNEGNFVHDLFIDSHDNIWLSQARSSKLKMIDQSFSLKYFDVPIGHQSEINMVREGPRGLYAASSGLNGYLFFKPHGSSVFTNISLPVNFKVLGDFNIHDLAIQNDVLWLASTEGLLRYDHHSVQRVDLGETMTTFAVSSVEVLDDKHILFSNSYGLLRLDVTTGDFWLYDENSGLPSNTVTDHGIFIDAFKRIWVGTSFGLAWGAHTISANQPTLKPFCVGAQVNGSTHRFVDGLTAPHGAFINLQFSSITFPENKITMQFRLDKDTAWHVFDDNEVSLSGLLPGRHTLAVRARKNTGFGWSEATHIPIHIGKPYWQKTEFLVSVMLIALLIAWISYGISARIMKKRREYLQNLIHERTQDLQIANEELILRNSELDRFVYSASHDLSAPLKSVLGLIMVARMDKSLDNHEQYLDMMERSVRKLEEFIEEVVSYSRNTRMPVKPEAFSFSLFVQNLLHDHQYSPNYQKIRFHVEDSTDKPMVADMTRLKIILNNLISNAIKFHWFEGSREPFVKITLTPSSDGYLLTVQDNGRGIEEKHLAHIFDMFYRATEQAQGSGLGLYILKESVVKLNGTVEAHSKIDEGTTFIITLPFHPLN